MRIKRARPSFDTITSGVAVVWLLRLVTGAPLVGEKRPEGAPT